MVKVTDLPASPEHGVCLVCPKCGDTFSASRGDYFWMHPAQPFRCQNDRALLHLVRKLPAEYELIQR